MREGGAGATAVGASWLVPTPEAHRACAGNHSCRRLYIWVGDDRHDHITCSAVRPYTVCRGEWQKKNGLQKRAETEEIIDFCA